MSMYNIYVEGQQAEEYKKRKRDERMRAKFDDRPKRNMYAYSDDGYHKNYVAADQKNYDPDIKRNPYKSEKEGGLSEKDAAKHSREMRAVSQKGSDIAHKHSKYIADKFGKHSDKADEFDNNFTVAVDAANKHVRRHPEQYKEQGIFAECVLI